MRRCRRNAVSGGALTRRRGRGSAAGRRRCGRGGGGTRRGAAHGSFLRGARCAAGGRLVVILAAAGRTDGRFFLFIVVKLVRAAEPAGQNRHGEENAADEHKHVRQIEDGELEELKLENVGHIAVDRAVDAVAEETGEQQRAGDLREAGAEIALDEGEHHERGERDQKDEQDPAQRAEAGHHAEGRAEVFDVSDVEKAGDQRSDAGVQRNVGHRPELEELIDQQSQKSNDTVNHESNSPFSMGKKLRGERGKPLRHGCAVPPPLLGEASRFSANFLGFSNRGRLSPAGRDVAAGDRDGGRGCQPKAD